MYERVTCTKGREEKVALELGPLSHRSTHNRRCCDGVSVLDEIRNQVAVIQLREEEMPRSNEAVAMTESEGEADRPESHTTDETVEEVLE